VRGQLVILRQELLSGAVRFPTSVRCHQTRLCGVLLCAQISGRRRRWPAAAASRSSTPQQPH